MESPNVVDGRWNRPAGNGFDLRGVSLDAFVRNDVPQPDSKS